VVAPQHVLAADWLHESWEPERVAQLLAGFSPQSGSYRIDLLTTAFKDLKSQLLDGALPQLDAPDANRTAAEAAGHEPGAAAGAHAAVLAEPWFGMEAAALSVPEALTAAWDAATAPPELRLPPRNPYIASDFSLCCDEGGAGPDAAARGAATAEAAAAALAAAEGLPVVLATPPALVLDEPGAGGVGRGPGEGGQENGERIVRAKRKSKASCCSGFVLRRPPLLPFASRAPFKTFTPRFRPAPVAQGGLPLPAAARALLLPAGERLGLRLPARGRAVRAVAETRGGRPERGRLHGGRGRWGGGRGVGRAFAPEAGCVWACLRLHGLRAQAFACRTRSGGALRG
jgi:hypothetical protein